MTPTPGNPSGNHQSRSLSDFTVELEVYSGPYEWLLALILKDEVEIFEVPLRELVGLYQVSRPEDGEGDLALERDTDFVDSAASLVLLKSRALSPDPDLDNNDESSPVSPEELAERLSAYLKIQRSAGVLKERFAANAGYYPSDHAPPPRPKELTINRKRLADAARRTFSRHAEPATRHLGPITVTVQELVTLIRASLSRSSGPLSFEDLTRDMDRLRAAVTFAAALSLANEGRLRLSQQEPFGPLVLEPVS